MCLVSGGVFRKEYGMSQRNIRVTGNANGAGKEIRLGDQEYTEAYYEARYNRFLQAVSRKAIQRNSLTLTQNGALTYSASGSSLVDYNAKATELRYASAGEVADAAAKAYGEDALAAVKLFFQTGDVRGGKGERAVFNHSMDWLIARHPAVALAVLPLIPEYTRWDNLVRLTVSENNEIAAASTKLVTEQFAADLAAVKASKNNASVNISLLAKWMPSLQVKKAELKPVVRHLLRALHMQEREYRHALSALRGFLHVMEKSMSAKEYDKIDMEAMTAKQQLRYAAFLQRVMAEKRHAYIQAVLRGEKKMHAELLNPLEICHEYTKSDWRGIAAPNEDLEALWSLLPDRTSGNGNTLVIRDGSGSMTSRLGQGSSATMLEAATAMAIYCAERLSGPFRDRFITFSSRPELVDLSSCKDLRERINLMYGYDDCSNTDIEATFDLLLDTAVSEKLSQEELPSYLLILSDMEFDAARGARLAWGEQRVPDTNTLFATIRKKWDDAGYQMPALVFWQLNGARTLFPEVDEKNNIIYLSGFSTNELTLVMAGEFERLETITTEEVMVDPETNEETLVTSTEVRKVILSPQEQLALKLSKPRYDAVEKAVRQGLAKENAAKASA